MLVVLTILAVVSAALHIRAEYGGKRSGVYVFKPLTVAFIIAIALWSQSSAYKYLIVAGLLFSLFGDIFLMLPSDRFIAGLVSFLIAHIFYIAAFTIDGATHRLSYLAAIALLAYGALMLRLLLPFLGGMKAPVIIYMLVILLMVWQAANRFMSLETAGCLLALAGACLFAASDSLLALNRFRSPFRSAQFLILTTYYCAQWLIALSAALRARG
ncbi:MAG TPA: lysoplasmalogenase [Pyrinomonadaceae bacterium]